MDLRGHLESYQKVVSLCARVPGGQEEPKRLVRGLDEFRGAELGYALLDENFQVLWRGERGACHHIDECLLAVWGRGVSAVAVEGIDGGVRKNG
jgi:hypothetical protein